MEYVHWAGREDCPSVSRLGFGTTRFFQSDLNTAEGFEKCVDLVTYAISKGINYFDVAPTYSNGLAEKILGEAFSHVRTPVYVAAKTGLSIDKTSDDVLRRIDSSLRLLSRDKIDFYHIWSVMDWTQYLTICERGGVLDGVMKAKDQKLIDHICISLHCDTDTVLRILEEDIFEGITISLNALNFRKWMQVLEKAREKHIAVVTMNSLAGGMIPQYKHLFENLDRSNDSVPQKALRFVLQLPGIHVALSGMPTREIIHENCTVIDSIHDVKSDLNFDLPVKERMCSGCGYCSPCTVGIPISACMQSYNHKALVESGDKIISEQTIANDIFTRIRANGVIFSELSQCISCHICEKRCTQKINISERMKWLLLTSKKYGYDNETMLNRLHNVEEKCRDSQRIAIWPAADYASRVLDYWKNPEFERRCVFINSSPAMWGKKFRDKTIEKPETIIKKSIDTIVIMHHRLQQTIYEDVSKTYKNCKIVCLHEDSDIDWFNRMI